MANANPVSSGIWALDSLYMDDGWGSSINIDPVDCLFVFLVEITDLWQEGPFNTEQPRAAYSMPTECMYTCCSAIFDHQQTYHFLKEKALNE